MPARSARGYPAPRERRPNLIGKSGSLRFALVRVDTGASPIRPRSLSYRYPGSGIVQEEVIEAPSKVHRGFETGAVGNADTLDSHILQIPCGALYTLLGCMGEMGAAYHGVYAFLPGYPSSVPEGVDYSPVRAAQHDYKAVRGLDEHGQVVEEGVGLECTTVLEEQVLLDDFVIGFHRHLPRGEHPI